MIQFNKSWQLFVVILIIVIVCCLFKKYITKRSIGLKKILYTLSSCLVQLIIVSSLIIVRNEYNIFTPEKILTFVFTLISLLATLISVYIIKNVNKCSIRLNCRIELIDKRASLRIFEIWFLMLSPLLIFDLSSSIEVIMCFMMIILIVILIFRQDIYVYNIVLIIFGYNFYIIKIDNKDTLIISKLNINSCLYSLKNNSNIYSIDTDVLLIAKE